MAAWFLRIALAIFAASTSLAAQEQACPYLPEFQQLQTRLGALAPAEAARALWKYRASHENPAACESLEIERLISERELGRLALVYGQERLTAQAIAHCSSFDPKTTQCNGAVEDGTAHPLSAGVNPRVLPVGALWRIDSELVGARLTGVYTAVPGELLDGKPVARVTLRHGKVTREMMKPGSVLIVIFAGGEGQNSGFTKAVWYF